MKLRKELNNKGFSLVELLIATVILAIVVAQLDIPWRKRKKAPADADEGQE